LSKFNKKIGNFGWQIPSTGDEIPGTRKNTQDF
jgi:hypothetical protein